MEPGRNRVFLNPNFNKNLIKNVPVRPTTVMHVNPNFCQQSQNIQSIPRAKIYINPNFVRANGMDSHNVHINNAITRQSYVKPSPLMDSSNSLTVPVFASPRHEVENLVRTNTASTQTFHTNSRYSLVRQNKSEPPSNNITKSQTNTIKISKYKSIKITDIKKNLDSVTPVQKVVPFKVSISHKPIIRNNSTQKTSSKISSNHVNRYKLVRATAGKPLFKRQTSITSKKLVCSQNRLKIGVYKKNNIPCPQYRKYGKCLRQFYGKCEFLHDRKHVSICRRFLNGVCHNDKCLLSHELSDKKMPTCYFYLKGMCTKEGCPYLHVKLNEKAKLCLDFIRGYCEKGDKCLNRHVTKNMNVEQKRRQKLKKMSQHKLMKFKLERNKVKSNMSNAQKRKSKIQFDPKSSFDNNDSASRYYKDSMLEPNTNESLEIKPSRCKLGTLPSFIQL